MCWFHPIHNFIHCCHMVIVLNVYLVHPCQGLQLGSTFSQTREGLPSRLWLTLLCSCLFRLMHSLSYMLWTKKHPTLCHWKVKVNFVSSKIFIEFMIYMYVCMYVCMYVYVSDIYIYIYLCVYIFIYIYIYI